MPVAKEADQVFALMTADYRVSRNTRAQWWLKNLNQVVEIPSKTSIEEFTEEIEIISMIPTDYQEHLKESEKEESTIGPYIITPSTKITFFARRYKFAYILDLSASMATANTQAGRVLFDEILLSLSESVSGLIKPFFVPGSRFLFRPDLFITVMAYCPFVNVEGKLLLVKGWKVNQNNFDEFIEDIRTRFDDITCNVADMVAKHGEEVKRYQKGDPELCLEALFGNEEGKREEVIMSAPDVALVNMVRQGLLALQLLPPQSNAGIIIITDGMLNLPNCAILESALNQVRHNNIACSFLQVGTNPNPEGCFGYMPYIDLMKFITQATFGAYIYQRPKTPPEGNYNTYHRGFLAWSFQRALYGFKADINLDHVRMPGTWNVSNPYFYSINDPKSRVTSEYGTTTKDQYPVRYKQIDNSVATSFTNLLSCRLREGFTIKNVNISESSSQIQVVLILPFKHNVLIEYQITAPWIPAKFKPEGYENEIVECHYEVTLEGSYSFLHDVTCQIKKPIKSIYRIFAIRQLWATLKSLSQSDQLLVHLNNFSRKSDMAIPEALKSGNSLFYLEPYSQNLGLASKTPSLVHFSAYWKPIVLLDINVWQKWMHTHRINVILKHDMPLPKHMHIPTSSSGKFNTVQNRQALASLNELLKEYSSFVLLEYHCYIKFIEPILNERSKSFFMIRVNAAMPCVVIHVAFIGGTHGSIRHPIVRELKDLIKKCTFPAHNLKAKGIDPAKFLEKQDGPKKSVGEEETSEATVTADVESAPQDVFATNEREAAEDEIAEELEGAIEIKQEEETAPSEVLEPKAAEEPPRDASTPTLPNENGSEAVEQGEELASTPPEEAQAVEDKAKEQGQLKGLEKPPYDINCCILMRTPIDKILICYEYNVQCEYICPNEKCAAYKTRSIKHIPDEEPRDHVRLSSESLETPSTQEILKKYMFHKRFLWAGRTQRTSLKPMLTSLNAELSKLIKTRLENGFHFAYNALGVVNMVREIDMQDEDGFRCPSVIQYIIFPPHFCVEETKISDSSESAGGGGVGGDKATTTASYCQLITECWIDAQNGTVVGSHDFLEGLTFADIPDALFRKDNELLSELMAEPVFDSNPYEWHELSQSEQPRPK